MLEASNIVVSTDQFHDRLKTMKQRAMDYTEKFDTVTWIEFYTIRPDGTMRMLDIDPCTDDIVSEMEMVVSGD